MIKQCSADEAFQLVHGDREVGFLDLREFGPFSEGHPLFAVSVPFSVLEARITRLVPRLSACLVLLDAGDGIAPVGAKYLKEMGYSDISVVDGGTAAWERSGYTLFKGVNVPSKTLGELAETRWHPNLIDSQTLRNWLREGNRFSFFDCRPPSEFVRMTVPGTSCLPTGEIAHRLPVLDRDGPVVITCAGRTRSIIGAVGLSLIAPHRRFYALENGTQGWTLAGQRLSRNNIATPFPRLSSTEAVVTRRRADAFLAEFNIPVASPADVMDFRGDMGRTTFYVDVRSEEEATGDRLPAFLHVPCGQIIQSTDSTVGVLRSRIVLADDLGLRAALAAFWLRCLGYSVYVVRIDDELRNMPFPDELDPLNITDTGIDPVVALQNVRSGKAKFLDLRHSQEFSREHVAGSKWDIRPRLANQADKSTWYIIQDEGPRPDLGSKELLRLGVTKFAVVRGGLAALQNAGAKIVSKSPFQLSEAIDVVSFAYGRHDGDLRASRTYLEWEQGLIAQISPAERATFQI